MDERRPAAAAVDRLEHGAADQRNAVERVAGAVIQRLRVASHRRRAAAGGNDLVGDRAPGRVRRFEVGGFPDSAARRQHIHRVRVGRVGQDVAQPAAVGNAQLDTVLGLVGAGRADRLPGRHSGRGRGAGSELRIGGALAIEFLRHPLRKVPRHGRAVAGFLPFEPAHHRRAILFAAAGRTKSAEVLGTAIAAVVECGLGSRGRDDAGGGEQGPEPACCTYESHVSPLLIVKVARMLDLMSPLRVRQA